MGRGGRWVSSMTVRDSGGKRVAALTDRSAAARVEVEVEVRLQYLSAMMASRRSLCWLVQPGGSVRSAQAVTPEAP